jgi:putative transposase
MPNHLQGIIVIADIGRGEEAGGSAHSEGDTISPASSPRLTVPANATNPKGEEAANRASPTDQAVSAASSPLRPRGTQPGSLGAIVQTYKAESTRRINRMMGTRGSRVWQRNYHERIIRNERELDAIREYIINNPTQWEADRERDEHGP